MKMVSVALGNISNCFTVRRRASSGRISATPRRRISFIVAMILRAKRFVNISVPSSFGKCSSLRPAIIFSIRIRCTVCIDVRSVPARVSGKLRKRMKSASVSLMFDRMSCREKNGELHSINTLIVIVLTADR